MSDDLMQKIVSLCKRRGFVFPGSEIYGGLANTWDYGPLGARLLQNIKNLWWERFVEKRDDMYPVDTGILMNSKVWEASGHTSSFTDPLVECKACHHRFRQDHVEGVKCPDCGGELTEAKQFNLMFQTSVGAVEDAGNTVYLRPETAQGMFVNFKNVVQTMRPKLPFGIVQTGKAFRNEITPGNFIFRTLEFEQMEIEYFVKEADWEKTFENWKEEMMGWLSDLGVGKDKLRWREHAKEDLSHYSKRTEDVEYDFPFGWGELYGLAYRTDFDLANHTKHSGEDLSYEDPKTGERFFPHVVEPTFGVSRTALVALLDAYTEEGDRVYLKLSPKLAPYKAAVFPLVSNKPELVKKAREVYSLLTTHPLRPRLSSTQARSEASNLLPVSWDERGNIGKRYAAQDEIGTPWCVTIDYKTLEDNTVTIRDRDTAAQVRVDVDKISEWLHNELTRS